MGDVLMRSLWFVSPALLVLCMASVSAQTSYPMITHMHPVAVQRGGTVEVTVEGKMTFAGVYKAILEGTGITAEIAGAAEATAPVKGKAAPPANQVRAVKMKVTVAPDAELGVREFRLASSLGLSSVGQLVVVDDPGVPGKVAN